MFHNSICILFKHQILLSVATFLPHWMYIDFDTEELISITLERTLNILASEFYFQGISLLKISQHEIRRFLLSFECYLTFNEPQITVRLLCIRLRLHSIERAMDLTDSFTWEDLPTRDADSGHLTAAGWIPLIQRYIIRIAVVILVFHFVQSSIRMLTNHETLFIVW